MICGALPGIAKVIVSGPGLRLASSIAARSEQVPAAVAQILLPGVASTASAVVLTTNVIAAAGLMTNFGSGLTRASTVWRSETSTRPSPLTSPEPSPAAHPYVAWNRSWRVTIPLRSMSARTLPRAMRPGSAAVTAFERKTFEPPLIRTENVLRASLMGTRRPDSVTASTRPMWIISRPGLRGKTTTRRNVPAVAPSAP